MFEFRIADGCGPTARILQGLVGEGTPGRRGVVCWGRGTHERALPALNAQAGAANKLQQLQRFREADLLTPPFWEAPPTRPEDYPVLGRHLRHHGGRDIALLMQPGDAEFFRSDFYTRYVPRQTEFRTWVYRRRHLGTYQKVQTRATNRVGANWGSGFSFRLVNSDAVPEALREIASKAVDCLGLDFGAVDVLQGVDNRLYLLECNSAPGVEGEGRQVIQALAQKIRRWQELNHPRRNGDREGG